MLHNKDLSQNWQGIADIQSVYKGPREIHVDAFWAFIF